MMYGKIGPSGKLNPDSSKRLIFTGIFKHNQHSRRSTNGHKQTPVKRSDRQEKVIAEKYRHEWEEEIANMRGLN